MYCMKRNHTVGVLRINTVKKKQCIITKGDELCLPLFLPRSVQSYLFATVTCFYLNILALCVALN